MGLRWTWLTASGRTRREASRMKPCVELMEGRLLLSQGLSAHPLIDRRRAMVAERVEQAQARTLAYNQEHSSNQQSIVNGVVFTKDTVNTGKKLATSWDVLKVGANFAKKSVAKDTTKVGWEYISAAFRGDTKTLDKLGKTPLVKKVGNDFEALSHTQPVRQVGKLFSDFGHAVATNYHKIF